MKLSMWVESLIENMKEYDGIKTKVGAVENYQRRVSIADELDRAAERVETARNSNIKQLEDNLRATNAQITQLRQEWVDSGPRWYEYLDGQYKRLESLIAQKKDK